MNTRNIAKRIVEESVVLLKNKDNLLPLIKKQKVVLFGRAQFKMFVSGNGSGATIGSENKNILTECEKNGLCIMRNLKEYYCEQILQEGDSSHENFDFAKASDTMNSGLMYEIFGKYHEPVAEYDVPEKLMEAAEKFSDTALIVIGRNSGGEECDRHLEEDYELTQSEKRLVNKVCRRFSKVIIILNINGLIDLEWIESFECIKSVLFIGIPGEEGAAAVANVLCGSVNPSGKLPVTIAHRYNDYPSAKDFSWNKNDPNAIMTYENYGLSAIENRSFDREKSPVTVYKEDIYAGYRYFDTFRIEPLFPFGHGLSYSIFIIEHKDFKKIDNGFEVSMNVRNTGDCAGKEVIQLYVSAINTKQERPYQELKGFKKTRLLQPGEEETIIIQVEWKQLSIYEEKSAAYIIEAGQYVVRLGNSSQNTEMIGFIDNKRDILIKSCNNRLCIQECNTGKINFLSQKGLNGKGDESKNIYNNLESLKRKLDLEILDIKTENERQVVNDTEYDLSGFSIEELAALCVGYGPGVPFSAFGDGKDPETIYDKNGNALTTNDHPTGCIGYVSPAIEGKGIHSVFYKDGPAGIGLLSWPTEMLVACSFDQEIFSIFGDGIGYECEQEQVNFWLAPALNLHRNPLGGRNFEYFSEDPFLTGICACEVTKGVQTNHLVSVCPKHFAINEQETFRRGSEKKNYDAVDSIISERAARELYLKPFEMLVENSQIKCIMTSFNKINGVFAGGNIDLCTHILREEWGYKGAVITDWGDMDVVVDGADALLAGNDIVMPGGPPVINQIRQGLLEGRITENSLKTAVAHFMKML